MVVGGYDNSNLDSTEVLVDGSDSWSLVGKLPHAASGLRAISVSGSIIVSGNIYVDITYIFGKSLIGIISHFEPFNFSIITIFESVILTNLLIRNLYMDCIFYRRF